MRVISNEPEKFPDGQVVDDVFEGWERLETQYATRVTEDHIDRLARLLKARVDWSGSKGPVLVVNPGHQYKEYTYGVGDWIDNKGLTARNPSANLGEWYPAGTYIRNETDG